MKLSQIILYVENMPNQVAFYRDVMGLTLSYPLDINDFSNEQWVTFATGGCSLALHGGGSQRLSENMPTCVFEVDNIQQVRDGLLSKGVKIGEILEAAPQVFIADGYDPEGNAFSLKMLVAG